MHNNQWQTTSKSQIEITTNWRWFALLLACWCCCCGWLLLWCKWMKLSFTRRIITVRKSNVTQLTSYNWLPYIQNRSQSDLSTSGVTICSFLWYAGSPTSSSLESTIVNTDFFLKFGALAYEWNRNKTVTPLTNMFRCKIKLRASLNEI